MDDLIRRSDAIKAINEWAVNLCNPKMIVREDAEFVIKTIPAAEPKKGEWLMVTGEKHMRWRECSECRAAYDERYKYNFCPNCGADMRKEQSDEV